MQKLNNEVMKMMKSAVEMCASKYNFDGDEAMRMICESEGLSCSSSSRVNKRNVNKKEKREIVKSLFPLPYNGELNGECCFGIRQNSGLYTQCPSNRLEDKAYCGSCEKQATKNEHGLPDYGSIQTRLSKYNKDEEFVDPSGKKPVAYTKIMKKLKLTEEQVREEAAKHNMTLDPRHFIEVEKKSGRPAKEPKEPKELKAKGRPKKSKKVLELAGEEEDLFASLVMSSNKNQLLEKVDQNEDIIEETVTSESEGDDNSSLGDVDVVVDAKPKSEKKPKVSAEEKAALAEQKKAVTEKKAAAEKKAPEKKVLAKQKKTKVDDASPAPVDPSVAEEADVVKKIMFEGKKYLKSKNTGIIYNMEQDVIGKWNEAKNRIDFDETGEESEEEYDEDE
jgi:hypothetical protein